MVTALGIKKEKKALAYAITEVKGEAFTQAREVNIAKPCCRLYIAGSVPEKVICAAVNRYATGKRSGRIQVAGGNSLLLIDQWIVE